MLPCCPHRFLPPISATRSPKKNNGRLRISSTSKRALCSAICTTLMTPNLAVRSANHCIVRSDKDLETISLTLTNSQPHDFTMLHRFDWTRETVWAHSLARNREAINYLPMGLNQVQTGRGSLAR